MMNRKPIMSGKFYPADKNKLIRDIENYFLSVGQETLNNVRAIISPHAGYIFSGEVAASGFSKIDLDKQYNTIFIITSSHCMHFKGASIYNLGNYETPLGEVQTDGELCNKLISENDVFSFHFDAHIQEHSLEVQLPFLQFALKNDFKIVPIVIGTDSVDECKQIAQILKPYFNQNNLFVISTDFSHYPDYKNAIKTDKKTATAIISNNTKQLLNTLKANKKLDIDNLSTSLCGWTSVLILMYTTEEENVEYREIMYKNSGDSIYGNPESVVGYYSIVITEKDTIIEKPEFNLSNIDKRDLLNIARNTLEKYISKNKIHKTCNSAFSDNLNQHCGVFVTLNKFGKLRGCIGRLESNIPLWDIVKEVTISSATQDNRFNAVSIEELKEIKIEISVLTPLKKIKSINELELGKHGIYIKHEFSSGTFLPQVATKQNWTKEEFIGYCSRDKVGIGYTGWKNAELFIYKSIIFDEDEFAD